MRPRREDSTVAWLLAPRAGRARVYTRHVRGRDRGPHVMAARRRVRRRRVGRPCVAVWDRLSAHRAQPVPTVVATRQADDRLEWPPQDGGPADRAG